jgi:hypothetical protein
LKLTHYQFRLKKWLIKLKKQTVFVNTLYGQGTMGKPESLIFGSIGVEFRDLCLLGRSSATLVIAPGLFTLAAVEIGCHFIQT